MGGEWMDGWMNECEFWQKIVWRRKWRGKNYIHIQTHTGYPRWEKLKTWITSFNESLMSGTDQTWEYDIDGQLKRLVTCCLLSNEGGTNNKLINEHSKQDNCFIWLWLQR